MLGELLVFHPIVSEKAMTHAFTGSQEGYLNFSSPEQFLSLRSWWKFGPRGELRFGFREKLIRPTQIGTITILFIQNEFSPRRSL